jgi:hypothetical protein
VLITLKAGPSSTAMTAKGVHRPNPGIITERPLTRRHSASRESIPEGGTMEERDPHEIRLKHELRRGPAGPLSEEEFRRYREQRNQLLTLLC